jgi:hypothetical protein
LSAVFIITSGAKIKNQVLGKEPVNVRFTEAGAALFA